MMRTAVQPDHWNIEASLCAGLTLVHYKAFAEMDALVALRKLYEQELPDQMRYGIHVLISQNGLGEITIGDTHEYGLHLEPFDNTEMNDRVIEYLRSFAQFADMRIAQSWHGIYPKTTDGSTAFVARPQEALPL